MASPGSTALLELADSVGWDACVAKGRESRGGQGQFFTPAPIARFLAAWFGDRGLDRPSLHVLDPGAGGGALTAAVVERIVALRRGGCLDNLKRVTLEVWESDTAFVPALERCLSACAAALSAEGVRAEIRLNPASYVEGAVRALDGGLFGEQITPSVTHAILNPPYCKLAASSRERALARSIGIDTNNLYALFVWLALRQLVVGGELSAITPRSFCNGPYFREFRRELHEAAAFDDIHLFDSRKEAFGRDEVLQENLLFHLVKGSGRRGAITISTGSLESPVAVSTPADQLVRLDDPDKVIHIATEQGANEVREFIESLPCRMAGLGIEVSTGPVVDFRLRDWLSPRLGSKDIPLIYPHCVRSGRVLPPLRDASEYAEARAAKKPVAIAVNDETRRWLVPPARFVLIKRFSSKEEKRRLVAGVLEPDDFRTALIGIENHLNFFHRRRGGLPAMLARGLCRFLNSSVADRYFRQFNGHTQVNATDLRAFRYPAAEVLEALGAAGIDDNDQVAIDVAMSDIIGAPSPK